MNTLDAFNPSLIILDAFNCFLNTFINVGGSWQTFLLQMLYIVQTTGSDATFHPITSIDGVGGFGLDVICHPKSRFRCFILSEVNICQLILDNRVDRLQYPPPPRLSFFFQHHINSGV